MIDLQSSSLLDVLGKGMSNRDKTNVQLVVYFTTKMIGRLIDQ